MNELDEMVSFIGDDAGDVAKARKALEWVTSKPEGLKKLQDAKKLHGQKLKILVSDDFDPLAVGFAVNDAGTPVIQLNMPFLDTAHYLDEHGKRHKQSLERFFAHELEHATQQDVMKAASEYNEKRQVICGDNLSINVEDDLPWEKYANRIRAAKGNVDRLTEILGEIFDTNVPALQKQKLDERNSKVVADPVMIKFINEFEVPAIRSENFIMGKYANEPARIEDYVASMVSSGSPDELEMQKKLFIESLLPIVVQHSPKDTTPPRT